MFPDVGRVGDFLVSYAVRLPIAQFAGPWLFLCGYVFFSRFFLRCVSERVFLLAGIPGTSALPPVLDARPYLHLTPLFSSGCVLTATPCCCVAWDVSLSGRCLASVVAVCFWSVVVGGVSFSVCVTGGGLQ